MKKVAINYILHQRPQYAIHTVNELIKLPGETRKEIVVNLLISNSDDSVKHLYTILKNNNIETNVFLTPKGNYMTKINTGIKTNCEYSIKLDEDIFLGTHLWDYFIENLDILNDEENLFLSPILTTGIPTVDYFIDEFLTKEQQQELFKIFLQTPLPSIWGADYSNLNQHTIKATIWNSDSFYNEVEQIDHYYKGVHPVRFSPQAQLKILEYTINNLHNIVKKNNYSTFSVKRPYFCNSIFGIKNKVWQNILEDKSLFKDDFEEVPLNLYREKNDLKMVFIKNGFAIHPSYNTINIFGTDYKILSDKLFNNEFFKQ